MIFDSALGWCKDEGTPPFNLVLMYFYCVRGQNRIAT